MHLHHTAHNQSRFIWCIILDCDMDSPLHTSLLRYATKKRRLLSSDKEDTGRADERIIHSECAAEPTSPSSSKKMVAETVTGPHTQRSGEQSSKPVKTSHRERRTLPQTVETTAKSKTLPHPRERAAETVTTPHTQHREAQPSKPIRAELQEIRAVQETTDTSEQCISPS